MASASGSTASALVPLALLLLAAPAPAPVQPLPLPLPNVITTSAAPGGVAIFGIRRPGDKLLLEYSLARMFKPFQVLTESVSYPMNTEQKAGVISQIEILATGRGAKGMDDVRIKSGGVNQKFVQLVFTSARGRGLDYKINIYGFPHVSAPQSSRSGVGAELVHQIGLLQELAEAGVGSGELDTGAHGGGDLPP